MSKQYLVTSEEIEGITKVANDALTAATNASSTAATAAGNAQTALNASQEKVATAKIADGAVTRAKLAPDALYSPVKFVTESDTDISVADDGATLGVNVDADVTITLSQEVSLAMNGRNEIAVYWFNARSVTIIPDGVRFAVKGQSALTTNSLRMEEKYDMIALKRFAGDTSRGDIWIIQGLVEVVS